MLDKPMTRSETDSNALPRGRLTKRHETNYARQRDVRNVTYRRDGKFQSAFGRATVLSMRTCQMQDRVRFEMANIKQTRLNKSFFRLKGVSYDVILNFDKKRAFFW